MHSRLVATLALTLCAAAAANAHPHPGQPAPRTEPYTHGDPVDGFAHFLPHPSRLGVQLEDMTPELREFMRAPKERGVLVVRVNEGSAAEQAGLRVGDVIIAADGEPVSATAALVHAVLTAEKDAKLALEIVRDGKPRTLEATLGGEPFAANPMGWLEQRMPELRESFEQRMRELEMRMQELEQRLRDAAPARDELDT